MTIDLVRIVEAAYDIEQTEDIWLSGILAAASPALDAGLGVLAYTYDASEPSDIRFTAVAGQGVSEGLAALFARSGRDMSSDYVRKSYRALSCATASEVPGWHQLPFIDQAAELGMRDLLAVNGTNPDGHGLCLNAFLVDETKITARRRNLLARVSCHLAAAHRLRRRLARSDGNPDTPEAILDHDGKVHHAEGEANSKSALSLLRKSAIAVANARGALRTHAPEQAIEEWKGLIAARWTLLEVSETDGRKYLVARQNQARTHGPDALTDREQQVVALAAMGHHNKLIAYNLGISHSTVRVLIARAARKVGVRSRDELIHHFAMARVDVNWKNAE
jgi:DNA-binding CsgD family transcriptional regulator